MLGEHERMCALWVTNLTGLSMHDIGREVNQNSLFRNSLHHKIYLLQEVGRVGLGFPFLHGDGLFSVELQRTLIEINDQLYTEELNRYLRETNLTAIGHEKLKLTKRLIEPPASWTGDCESVWVKGEASLHYMAQFVIRDPIETFKERGVQFLTERMPGIPKPLANAAYGRLEKFSAN